MALINVTGAATTLLTEQHRGVRSWVIIQNNDAANAVWLGFGSNVPTAGDGIKIPAGGLLIIGQDNIGMLIQEVKAITAGATVQVHVQADGAL